MDQLQAVFSPDAPAPIGPYSQAIKIGDLVYTSGQVALDGTGDLVSQEVEAQTEQVMKNLAAVLDAAGSGLGQVIKTTVFLADMNDFTAMNQVYGRYFTGTAPARSTVQVARLPKDARVEIEVIARCAK